MSASTANVAKLAKTKLDYIQGWKYNIPLLRQSVSTSHIFRRGAAVAQEAVNFEVAGSNPAAGAKPR